MTSFPSSDLKNINNNHILKKFKASRLKINKRADGNIWIILKTKILR